jgi:hypothetical protein
MSLSVSFCGMDDAIGMFGGALNRKQIQRLLSGVSKVMLRSRLHSNHIASTDALSLPSHECLTRTSNKEQNLVNIVDFLTNVFSRSNAHQDHLGMPVREQESPEVTVL